MIYIVKAFNKKLRYKVPIIISFIRSDENGEPNLSNYYFYGEEIDYKDIEFGIVKNIDKEKEDKYEKELVEQMQKFEES